MFDRMFSSHPCSAVLAASSPRASIRASISSELTLSSSVSAIDGIQQPGEVIVPIDSEPSSAPAAAANEAQLSPRSGRNQALPLPPRPNSRPNSPRASTRSLHAEALADAGDSKRAQPQPDERSTIESAQHPANEGPIASNGISECFLSPIALAALRARVHSSFSSSTSVPVASSPSSGLRSSTMQAADAAAANANASPGATCCNRSSVVRVGTLLIIGANFSCPLDFLHFLIICLRRLRR